MQSLAQILYLQLFLWVSFAEILSLMTLKKSGGGEANILQNKYKINKMHFNCIVKSMNFKNAFGLQSAALGLLSSNSKAS